MTARLLPTLLALTLTGCFSLGDDARRAMRDLRHPDFPGQNLANPHEPHSAEAVARLERDTAACQRETESVAWRGGVQTTWDATWEVSAACFRARGWQW